MADPTSYEELGELVQGYADVDWESLGDIRVVKDTDRDLILLNYTAMAQINNRWNWLEQVSRGLVVNTRSGNVIGRCLPKFWNYGERLPAEDAHIVEATEKMDGSMILIWWYGGQWNTSTRGSFTSEQAVWAKGWLTTHCKESALDKSMTYVCEAIYPENRIVVGYGDRSELCLLAVLNTDTGEELDYYQLEHVAERVGFGRPQTFYIASIAEYLAAAEKLSANEEGWVLKYSDGSRFKIKGTAYKLAHKLLSGLTPKRMVELLMSDSGERGLYELLRSLPDEFYHEFKQMADEIVNSGLMCMLAIEMTHLKIVDAVGLEDRKAYALMVQAEYPQLMKYMFAYRDGKPMMPIIYKSMLAEMKDTADA